MHHYWLRKLLRVFMERRESQPEREWKAGCIFEELYITKWYPKNLNT
jgi:hypothetical protein